MKLVFKNEKDKVFFTSDTHFFHSAIIDYCHRPFKDKDQMDEKLIINWNDVIPKDGIVFHAGDFAMTGNVELIQDLIKQLNGQIYLTLGNHDYQNRFDREKIKKLFYKVDDMFYLQIYDDTLKNGHVNIQMCHYPLMYWYRNFYMLHGHVHGGPLSTANEVVPFHNQRYDIGVDNTNFIPISYFELSQILNFPKKIKNE